MNKLTLNAAVKKYSSIQDVAELTEALSKDEKNFSPEDIEEIINAIANGGPKKSESKPVVKIGYNDDFDLSFLDYEALKAEEIEEDGEKVKVPSDTFKKYKEIEGQLIDRKMYMFLKFKAKPNIERGFSRKTGAPIVKLVGIELVNSKHVNETLMEYRHIKDLNAQIMDLNNRPENSVYYLLKK